MSRVRRQCRVTRRVSAILRDIDEAYMTRRARSMRREAAELSYAPRAPCLFTVTPLLYATTLMLLPMPMP